MFTAGTVLAATVAYGTLSGGATETEAPEYVGNPDADVVQIAPDRPSDKDSLSCDAFPTNTFKPPSRSVFGITKPGLSLDESSLGSDNMEQRTTSSGRTILAKHLGMMVRIDTDTAVNLDNVPGNYRTAIKKAVNDPANRLGICELDKGLTVTATASKGYENAFYGTDNDSIELVFQAAAEDNLYQDERDVHYTVTHEVGHQLRGAILERNENKTAVRLVKELDNLYLEQAQMGMEEFRRQHGEQMSSELAQLNIQYQAINTDIVQGAQKESFSLAIQYLQEQLHKPGGLDSLGITKNSTTSDGKQKEYGLQFTTEMIAAASEVANPGDPLVDLNNFLNNNPDSVDINPLIDNNLRIMDFLDKRFVSDGVLPGNSGGHGWEDSNETFATLWSLTRYISTDNYDKILETVPANYQGVTKRQLNVVLKLRNSLRPQDVR
jgi:hypothetical protein